MRQSPLTRSARHPGGGDPACRHGLHHRYRASVLFSLLWLSACSLLPAPQAVVMHRYLLSVHFAPSANARRDGPSIVVAPLRADPGFDTSRMAYAPRRYVLAYYAYHQWVAPPARMIQPLLVQALDSTGHFRAVASASAGFGGGLRLDTELVSLVQDFAVRPSRVRLVLRAQLVDRATGAVLATQVFTALEIAPSDDAYGGVIAANRALARVLRQVAEFCVAHGRVPIAPVARPG